MRSITRMVVGIVLAACIGGAEAPTDMTQKKLGSETGSDFKNARLDQAVFGSRPALEDSIVGIQDVVFISPNPKKKSKSHPSRPIQPLMVAAELGHADFEAASLVQASFIRADLREANFTNADLTQASMHGANLSKANLSGAKLNQSHLEGADLSDAVGLTQKQLDLAMLNEQTKLPAGLQRPKHVVGD